MLGGFSLSKKSVKDFFDKLKPRKQYEAASGALFPGFYSQAERYFAQKGLIFP